ncbi:MAG: hypothetical protein AAF268_02645 [Cyanobacteria bacterium P01_A01_bin.3]
MDISKYVQLSQRTLLAGAIAVLCAGTGSILTAEKLRAQDSQPPTSNSQERIVEGTAPQPGDPGLLGVALIYMKDWDSMREYEKSIQPLVEEYNIQIFNQMLPGNVNDPLVPQPDRVDLFYAENPGDLERIFQDERLQERLTFRDEFATERVVFITGTSIWPVDNQPIPPAR